MNAWFAVLAVLFAAGAGVLVQRFVRSLRLGFSIRLQMFLALTGASFGLACSFILLVVSPEELAAAEPSSATLRLGFSVLLLAIGVAIAAIFIGHLVADPLERLTQTAQRIAAGERQAALPVPRGREVRDLTLAFEVMRAKLEERHMLENFVADLSHELKNPIASIRASSEVLADALESDPQTARHFLTRIEEAALKLDHLTADLLTLARVEAHGQARRTARLDLRDLLHKAIATVRPASEARALLLQVHAPDAAWVRGEAPALQRAIENCSKTPAPSHPPGARSKRASKAMVASTSCSCSTEAPASTPRSPHASSSASPPPARPKAAPASAWPSYARSLKPTAAEPSCSPELQKPSRYLR